MHVNEWIEERTYGKCPDGEKYAVAFLHIMATSSAVDSWVVEPIMKQHKLFCMWKDNPYRVTGCSSMGDIWLRSDFAENSGYDHRVNILDCSQWSETEIVIKETT